MCPMQMRAQGNAVVVVAGDMEWADENDHEAHVSVLLKSWVRGACW